MNCTVCESKFNLDEDGGVDGMFGMIPVTFCPTCLSCMFDMVEQINGDDFEEVISH